MTRSVGFTGTQQGMSAPQIVELRRLLILEDPGDFHHGDCVGADAEADVVARSLGCHMVIHPPSNSAKRAWCGSEGDDIWTPAPYLDRDLDIVESSTLLIAAPLSEREEVRSGTWYTVRAARRAGRRVLVIRRNGESYDAS